MKSYPLGDQLNFVTTFYEVGTGAPTNPTTTTLELYAPDHTLVAVTPDNPSVGQFTGTYTPLQSGVWSYRWLGVGTVQAASQGQFEVRPSVFQPGV